MKGKKMKSSQAQDTPKCGALKTKLVNRTNSYKMTAKTACSVNRVKKHINASAAVIIEEAAERYADVQDILHGEDSERMLGEYLARHLPEKARSAVARVQGHFHGVGTVDVLTQAVCLLADKFDELLGPSDEEVHTFRMGALADTGAALKEASEKGVGGQGPETNGVG